MKKTKIYTLFLFFITILSLYNIPTVKGYVTEDIFVYDVDESIIGVGWCYYGWDGLYCGYSDWLNSTYAYFVIPPNTIGGNTILKYDLINSTILDFYISDVDVITNIDIEINNYSAFSDENGNYNFDKYILTSYPPTASEVIHDVTIGLVDYVYEIPIWQLTRSDSDLNSIQPVYVSAIRINMNATESYQWSIRITTLHVIEVTYEAGGWDEFSDRLIDFIPATIIYIVLLWIFGSKYGYMGGGFACILSAIILGASNDTELIPLSLFMIGFGIIFFLAELKKRDFQFIRSIE